MEQENRRDVRYSEIGRVFATELCSLPGILDDISASGCKIHFPISVVVDLENEYELKIAPSHFSDQAPLKLMCQPQWAKEVGGETTIGFKILYSPDATRLTDFITYLESLSD